MSIESSMDSLRLSKYYDECWVLSNFNKVAFISTVISELKMTGSKLTVDLSLLDNDIKDEEMLACPVVSGSQFLIDFLVYLAECCNYKCIYHPDWGILAGRLEMQRLKLLNRNGWMDTIKNTKTMWDEEYYTFVHNNHKELLEIINPIDDYSYSLFGLRTLEKSYFARHNDVIIETPQLMYLRVATFIHMPDIQQIKSYYLYMSKGYFTHASPTLFNAGLRKGSLASCFLLCMEDDLESIFKCLGHCALISKATGGIGLDISKIRHSKIGSQGQSSGIVPMLQVYNATMKYVDQGGRRKGSATIFLQPWHVDFLDFLMLKRSIGSEEYRARDLFYSVWSCDLFMKRVKNNETWSLFCPKKCSGLTETYGDEFDMLYLKYEHDRQYEKQMPARDLWNELLKTQIEAGMPFIAHRDTANYTSNQKNLGLIRSSNLCMEIVEVTGSDVISSCNLASIALDEFVVDGQFQYFYLGKVVTEIVKGLNKVIDKTWYPLGPNGSIANTNKKYRPLGIGVQGLAETFFKLKLAWTDEEARAVNKKIFCTIYYYASLESCNEAKLHGAYDGFEGSPAANGLLKPDLVNENNARLAKLLGTEPVYKENGFMMYKWDLLKRRIKKYGLRNSLLVALMPTASSAQIRSKTESFEPITSNMYVRTVLSGAFPIVNKYLTADLMELNMWNNTTINNIMKNEGSVQFLSTTDVDKQGKLERLKEIYKTAFELKQKVIVDMAIDRSLYVCQSQSLNIFIKDPNFTQLTNLHFYAWENGLTTGMYYLRTSPATEAVKFTLLKEETAVDISQEKKKVVCTDDVCVMCQS